MSRSQLLPASFVLCVLFIWLGLKIVRADSAPASQPNTPATSQASTQSATPPTTFATTSISTQPLARDIPPAATAPSASTGRTQPMPHDYLVLLTRSMFVRGHVADSGHLGARTPRNDAPPAATSSLQRAENGLIFNGVTQTTTGVEALIEDTSTGHVQTVRSGDAVARGKIGRISLDTLEYISDGRPMDVRIGQTLAGGVPDVSAVPSPASTEPSGPGASPQDILERLRQKRLQQLGGK